MEAERISWYLNLTLGSTVPPQLFGFVGWYSLAGEMISEIFEPQETFCRYLFNS